jgi:hypothetical protein
LIADFAHTWRFSGTGRPVAWVAADIVRIAYSELQFVELGGAIPAGQAQSGQPMPGSIL